MAAGPKPGRDSCSVELDRPQELLQITSANSSNEIFDWPFLNNAAIYDFDLAARGEEGVLRESFEPVAIRVSKASQPVESSRWTPCSRETFERLFGTLLR